VSVAEPPSSAARTALFQLRVALIEAFLDHDCGDAGPDEGGRAAVTTGSTDEPAAGPGAGGDRPGDGGSVDTPSPPSETECRLLLAPADRDRASLAPPEYLGTDNTHNKAELQKRRDCGSCHACRMGLVKYNLFHLNACSTA
jgi:hypothetical protein